MKIIRQLVSFAVGVAVGGCLYSLLRVWLHSQVRPTGGAPPAGPSHPRSSLLPPWVQRPAPRQVHTPLRKRRESRRTAPVTPTAPQALPQRPETPPVHASEPADEKELSARSVPSLPPAPTVFKSIGYVQKADGDVEAIIMQEDQVVVVHIGDLIAGRYRVTEVSPDAINAVDEERTPSPMENPGGAQSATMTASRGPLPSGAPAAPPSEQGGAPLGFVQEANGEVQTVVADGSGVSLVPQAPATALVQATPPAQTTLEASTLPGPVGPKAERPKVKPPARPDLSNRNPRKAVDEAPTFIFQTLGSVETQDGDKRAVVADGSEVYLVKQREVFADQYQVTSVDAVLVLAIRVPQRQTLSTLPAQAESGRQVASKKLNEQTQFPLFDWANYPGAHQAGALANPLLTNLGADPFGVSPAGSGTQLQFFTADSPNVGF